MIIFANKYFCYRQHNVQLKFQVGGSAVAWFLVVQQIKKSD